MAYTGIGALNDVYTSNASGTLPNFQVPGASSGLLKTASKTLNSTQVKSALTNTYSIVPAQGAGTIIIPYFLSYKTIVPTSDAFTNPGGAQFSLDFYDGINFFPILDSVTNSIIVVGTTTYNVVQVIYANLKTYLPAQIENLPIVIDGQSGSANYTGNVTGDNSIVFNIQYIVQTL